MYCKVKIRKILIRDYFSVDIIYLLYFIMNDLIVLITNVYVGLPPCPCT